MRQKYKISGMTCNGCKTNVELHLRSIPGIKDAAVDLESGEAAIEMESYIPLQTFQDALPPKYTITEKNEVNVFHNSSAFNKDTPQWKQLFPLFLIFGYISTTAFFLNNKPFSGDGFMLDFMGLFYIVFSFFKMLDLRGFSESFRMYDPLAKRAPAYGLIYPFIETILGMMFLFRYQIDNALFATLIALGITTVGVTKVLLNKEAIVCACLGTALRLPMTKATFIENSVMIIMAIVMLTDTV